MVDKIVMDEFIVGGTKTIVHTRIVKNLWD